jgi:hypothetical protein
MTVTDDSDQAPESTAPADLNAELREIPAETRRAHSGWRQIGVPTER